MELTPNRPSTPAAGQDVPREVRTALANATAKRATRLETPGSVVHTVRRGRPPDAEEATVSAVSRGGDTDTLGAVCGAAAGARFGTGAIPDRWLDVLDVETGLREFTAALV